MMTETAALARALRADIEHWAAWVVHGVASEVEARRRLHALADRVAHRAGFVGGQQLVEADRLLAEAVARWAARADRQWAELVAAGWRARLEHQDVAQAVVAAATRLGPAVPDHFLREAVTAVQRQPGGR